MSGVIVFCKEVKGIFQGLSTAPVDVTVQTPRRPRVIEPGPDGPHCDLIGILRLHLLVKVTEIFAPPVTAIRCPAFGSRMHPRVAAFKRSSILRWRVVLVKDDGRRFPAIHHLANLVPIGIAPLWKYEDDRAPFIQEVSIATHCSWTDVLFVSNVHGVRKRLQVLRPNL